MSKPFEPKELQVRMAKLLELRRKLQERYAGIQFNAKVKPTEGGSREEMFLGKVQLLVHDNIDDEEFGIQQICRALGVSRSQLHNKLKALTGKSTSHFLRGIRLRQAKEMLLSTDMTISEIAFGVGFTYPTYFSRVYHEEFGESPTETRMG